MKCVVNIFYAPPPDGDDASAAYARRLSDIFKKEATVEVDTIASLTDDDDGPLLTRKYSNDERGQDATPSLSLTIFLISCSADGSVDRSVRKVMRKLSGNSTSDATQPRCNETIAYACALLGHARCENSANQMADTIFGTGRRFEKTLGKSEGLFGSVSLPLVPRFESQVELCGPETDFDPWLKTLLHKIQSC